MVRSSVGQVFCNWLGEIFVSLRVGMKARLITAAVGGLALALCATAYAHHGNSAYDESKPITLQGTVTEFDWVNPHTQIYFDVKAPNGRVAHWGCETLSPGKLTRAGWSKDSVKAGDHITITMVTAKTGAPVGILQKVIFADGRQLGTSEGAQQ
jgi:hypothetical protein